MPPAVPAVAAVTDERFEALAGRLVREGWGRRVGPAEVVEDLLAD
jgi:hypothetical protein